jgi:WD40-like Beta Propeller Repeat
MNADGTGQANLTNNAALDTGPAWSPSGEKIAFATTRDGNSEIYVMNPDGTGQTNLTNNAATDSGPDWSPDGAKIAFASRRDGNGEIYVMAADGSNPTRLTTNGAGDFSPAFSPDGQKITFRSNRDGNGYEIYVMNTDGSNQTRLTQNTWLDVDPDWQPTAAGYPRPKGATPTRVSLVLAYKPCSASSANSTHGAPLVGPSCKPPLQASSFLSVGTPDANGAQANAVGSVRFDVKINASPTPSDVLINARTTDVRCKTAASTTCAGANALAGPDYAGELQARVSLRITDLLNGSAATPATVVDSSFPVTVPCSGTVDTSVGAACAISTSSNTLVPGFVKTGERAIFELGQVQVFDGGSDGAVSTTADNTLFMDEGLFVP